jgi:hypothetical protein
LISGRPAALPFADGPRSAPARLQARATELREAAEMSLSATVVGLVITHHSRNLGLHAMIATVVPLSVVFSRLNVKTVAVMDPKGVR